MAVLTRRSLTVFATLALLATVCAAVLPRPASAAGTSAGDFLLITPDPRISSLGGNAVGEKTPLPTAAFTNPAAIAGVDRPWFSFAYQTLPGDLQYHYSSIAVPLSYGTVGGSLGVLSYGNLTGYTASFEPRSVDASSDITALLSFALPVRRYVPVLREYGAVGVNLRFLQEKLGFYTAETVAADVGAIVNIPYVEGLSAGLAYRNMGGGLKFVKQTSPLPETLAVGLAYRNPELKDLRAVLDVDMPGKEPAAVSLGLSVTPVYFLSLRGGYRTAGDSLHSDFRGGFGLNFGSVSVDYSFTPMKYFNAVHHLAVNVAIGSILKKESAADYYLESHFDEAIECYYRKDYIKARQRFEEILAVYPEHRPSQRYLEKIVAAIENMETVRARRTDEYLLKAQEALERKDFVAARRYYRSILGINPDSEDARLGLETVWNQLEEIKREKARQENWRTIEQLWQRAQIWYQQGEYIKAKDELRTILELDPGNPSVTEFIVEIDNQLAKIAASEVNELYNRAAQFYTAGNYAEAIKYFEAVVIAAPHRLDAQDYIARCKQNLSEAEARERAAKLAREQQRVRKEMESTYNRALDAYEKGQYAVALDYFTKSEEMATQYQFDEFSGPTATYLQQVKSVLSEQHYKTGFELFRKNRFEAAAAEYRKALQFNPDNASAKVEYERMSKELGQKLYEQGMGHYSRGDVEKAREMLNQSLSYDPDKVESKRALERIR